MDHRSRPLGTPIDGILGFPTFQSFLRTLDYHTQEVRIQEGTLPPIDDRIVVRDVVVAIDGTPRPTSAGAVRSRTTPRAHRCG